MTRKKRPWWIYQGEGESNKNQIPSTNLHKLGEPPPWRQFGKEARQTLSTTFVPEPGEIDRVNAALLLRRPLLITGKPGVGKTSLAYAVSHELGLDPVLRWSVTSRTTLQDGLYRYDAIGRLQETQRQKSGQGEEGKNDETSVVSLDISNFVSLGPLGTAFVARTRHIRAEDQEREIFCPRVLLIDEIDKSDIDLPNDLLHLFEEGAYQIPELARLKSGKKFDIRPDDFDERLNNTVPIEPDGWVHCRAFPLVIMTSNGERAFPPAFLRRCLQLRIDLPDNEKLERIVKKHFQLHPQYAEKEKKIKELIQLFLGRRDGTSQESAGTKQELSTDQLLNAVYLVLENIDPTRPLDKEALIDALWTSLSGQDTLRA